MDEITKGVVETTSVPENTEQLLKINIKDGKASALLFANPNGSKVKQRLDALEERFNNLKTINYEELYGPGNIDINSESKNPIVFIKNFGFTYADVFRILASTD